MVCIALLVVLDYSNSKAKSCSRFIYAPLPLLQDKGPEVLGGGDGWKTLDIKQLKMTKLSLSNEVIKI